jgi:hypothetical protein
VDEEDVEVGEALLVSWPVKRRPELPLVRRSLPKMNCGCLPSVVFARLRIVVRPFSRTNITIASFVSRQPT